MNTILSNHRSEQRILLNRRNRNRELRRNILIMILAVALIVTMSVLFFGTKSMAAESNRTIKCKSFVSIQIKAGDTLDRLAEEYASFDKDSFINEVKYINNLEDDSLIDSLYLVIPQHYEIPVQ